MAAERLAARCGSAVVFARVAGGRGVGAVGVVGTVVLAYPRLLRVVGRRVEGVVASRAVSALVR